MMAKRSFHLTITSFLLTIFTPTVSLSSPWSAQRKNHNSPDRRSMITSLVLSGCLILPTRSQAACLQGDTSPDCIGFYKVPLDDSILPYINSPEKLAQFAPGVRWVPPIEYPATYKAALAELQPLKQRTAALNDWILQGKLTEVGVELLSIIPRLTVSGRVVVSNLEGSSQEKRTGASDLGLRALRIEASYLELVAKLNSVDILIGQALRGDLGSLTAAQIQILSELRDSNNLFDDMILAVPKDFKVR
jgi:hypothetical protein